MSEWIQSHKISAAWLALDAGDNDPARFFTYWLAAIQTVHASVGEFASPLLRLPQLPPLESLVAPILNDLANLSQDMTLILDDYHVIENEIIHNALTFLLEHLPPKIHSVIATRAGPPLPLSRLRAHNQLVELRGQDLQWNTNEVAAFLNRTIAIKLSRDDVEALTERT
ncbi:MAG: hypothetical protein HZB51_03130 [Chloroflexi bacterium]|nr:hypothetical protein [Chloroflexota bacterium]